jgi:hypothetical protein
MTEGKLCCLYDTIHFARVIGIALTLYHLVAFRIDVLYDVLLDEHSSLILVLELWISS